MKLIKDLGYLYAKPTSVQSRLYGIYECPKCAKHFKTMTANVLSRKSTQCRHCASLNNNSGYHNLSDTKLYKVWTGMKQRCYDSNRDNYERYGGRGVKVCKEWLRYPVAFINWAEANGYAKGLQLDKDELSYKLGINPPIYSPETCQFVTPQRNRIITEEIK